MFHTLADIIVELLGFVGKGSHQAPRVNFGHAGHHLGKQVEEYQCALQGVLAEAVRALAEFLEYLRVHLDIAFHQRPGQFALAFEVVEEPALGDGSRRCAMAWVATTRYG